MSADVNVLATVTMDASKYPFVAGIVGTRHGV
jgi:hypothetical protein